MRADPGDFLPADGVRFRRDGRRSHRRTRCAVGGSEADRELSWPPQCGSPRPRGSRSQVLTAPGSQIVRPCRNQASCNPHCGVVCDVQMLCLPSGALEAWRSRSRQDPQYRHEFSNPGTPDLESVLVSGFSRVAPGPANLFWPEHCEVGVTALTRTSSAERGPVELRFPTRFHDAGITRGTRAG